MQFAPAHTTIPSARALRRLASGLRRPRHASVASRLDRMEVEGDAPELLDIAVDAYYEFLERLSSTTATYSLVEGFRRLNETDYSVLSLREKALLWSALCELKLRFPAASQTADAWLGSLDEDDNGDGPEYGRVFLSAAGF